VLCDETAIDVVLHEDHNDIHVTIGDDTAIDVMITGSVGTSDIFSNPPSGCYQIVNLYLNASKHIVVVYNSVPED